MERKWSAMDPAFAVFPVELRPVFIEASGSGGDLFQASGFQALPRHQAVVDAENSQAFAVVTEDYHLVTNQQAYDLAADSLKQVFDFTSMADMACLNVTMMPLPDYDQAGLQLPRCDPARYRERGEQRTHRSFDAKGATDVSSVGVVTMVSPLFWPRGHFAGVENA
ncbi:hypothetical protein ACF8GG_07395 [Pseudomonas sp. yb_1]|uniref:hypothetical protein n=1 Tax=Pseudomonas sp. yb_1 TaxID=3367217 RepID=UPI00370AFBCC